MGNAAAGSNKAKIIPKALIPFRFHTNGFQVDYKVFRIRKKPNIDEEDTYKRYDDSFLELNTRSRIVGDIRKVFTHSALNISQKYTSLKRHYYSRMGFGCFTLIFALILINVGFKENSESRGRLLIVFGVISFILCVITWLVVIFTSQQLKALNTDFCNTCVEILQREKVVTWTANFQHLLFNIKCPHNGRYNEGVVEVMPNPFFKKWQSDKDEIEQKDINTPNYYDQLPLPPWAVDENYDYRHNNHSGKYIKPPPVHRITYGNPKGNYLYELNEQRILDVSKPYHKQLWNNKLGFSPSNSKDYERLPLMQVDFNDEKIEEETSSKNIKLIVNSDSNDNNTDSNNSNNDSNSNDSITDNSDIINEQKIDNNKDDMHKLSQIMSEMDKDKQDITFDIKQKKKLQKYNYSKYIYPKKTKKTKYSSKLENNDDEKTSTNNIKKTKRKRNKKKSNKNNKDKIIKSKPNNNNNNNNNNDNDSNKGGILSNILPKNIFAPKAFDDGGEIDAVKVVKIHDTIIQQFFLENQEECEGYGEDTKLIDNPVDMKEDNNNIV